MGNVKYEMDYAGIGQLLKCQELCDGMQTIGNNVASRAGVGYEADTQVGKKRAHTYVRAVTAEAYYNNLKNNTLLKAIQ